MGSCSFHPDGNHSSFHPGRNSIRLPPLHPATTTFHPDVIFCSAAITSGCLHFHPDVSHPEFYCRRHSTRMFTSGILTPDGRRGCFNFSGYTYPDPLIARTWRVSQIFCQCRGVLLKLPDICHLHFEIFFFR